MTLIELNKQKLEPDPTRSQRRSELVDKTAAQFKRPTMVEIQWNDDKHFDIFKLNRIFFFYLELT